MFMLRNHRAMQVLVQIRSTSVMGERLRPGHLDTVCQKIQSLLDQSLKQSVPCQPDAGTG